MKRKGKVEERGKATLNPFQLPCFDMLSTGLSGGEQSGSFLDKGRLGGVSFSG
jgi:hypothetical protein